MMYIEASETLRLRPTHLLLMIYRYLSGVYQIGDLSALNYVKGFLDGDPGQSRPGRVLTVSGHGIGEAEMWLIERIPGCTLDAISFRLVDTQLMQFLRAASAGDIERVFSNFTETVAPYGVLFGLAGDPGLVPYWCAQAELIKRCFEQGRLGVFSNSPLTIGPDRLYDLIYVSHGAQYFTRNAAEKLRSQLSPQGHLAILMPAPEDGRRASHSRFADSEPVRKAKALFRRLLEDRGYVLGPGAIPPLDFAPLATRSESIRFSVLAAADSVVVGELILSSLGEHISDRARLEVLDETAAKFKGLRMPVNEELELHIMGAQ
jgi:hypothetical protein